MSNEDFGSLIGAVKKGMPEAGNQLVNLLFPRLFRFLARLGADATMVEDTVQEALLRLWKAVNSADDIQIGWVYRVAYNAYIDNMRRQREQQLDGTLDARPAEAEPSYEQAELLHQLSVRIGALPVRQREVVFLRLEERTFQEIGDVLGIDQSVANRRWNAALERLRCSFTRTPKARKEVRYA